MGAGAALLAVLAVVAGRRDPGRAPSAAPIAPSTIAAAPAEGAARLVVDFEHHMRAGSITVWVDDAAVLERALEGRLTQRLGRVRLEKGRVLETLDLAPAPHAVRVEVSWDGKTRSAETPAPFTAGRARTRRRGGAPRGGRHRRSSNGVDGRQAGGYTRPMPDPSKKAAAVRVLVVDDSVDSAETHRPSCCSIWGHDVRTRKRRRRRAGDRALLPPGRGAARPIVLPVMDGFETARAGSWKTGGLAGKLLVAVTGFGGAEDRLAALTGGGLRPRTSPSPSAPRR